MNAKWFKGVDPKNKDKRTAEVLNYRNAFDALRELLENDYEETTPDYKNPSWSHEQADTNGANRKLKQIIALINIKE